jgi:hypothetical protein
MPLSQLPQAIAKAAAIAAAALAVTTEPDIAVVWHEKRKEWAFYSANAWQRPSETPFLPWAPPPYPAVAFVQPDGTWTPGPGLPSKSCQ